MGKGGGNCLSVDEPKPASAARPVAESGATAATATPAPAAAAAAPTDKKMAKIFIIYYSM